MRVYKENLIHSNTLHRQSETDNSITSYSVLELIFYFTFKILGYHWSEFLKTEIKKFFKEAAL